MHTASEKRQSSPGWASGEAGPGQDCSGESGLGDSEAGWLASSWLCHVYGNCRSAEAGAVMRQIDSGRFLGFPSFLVKKKEQG